MMLIPYQELATETLNALLEAFVNREGTDYGEHEQTLAQKVTQVKSQLSAQQLLIVYDEASESVNILSKADYQQGLQEFKQHSEQMQFSDTIPLDVYDDEDRGYS